MSPSQKLKLCFKIISLLLLPSLTFSYFPFLGEDAGTIGRYMGFEVENNLAYFRHYDGSYQQDYVFQIAVGLRDDLDLAFFIPYSRLYDGTEVEGLGDAGFYLKHIPYRKKLRLGYLLQINLDTGREGIGYGKTTGNLNLVAETEHLGNTYNINLLYLKSGHVERLRDSYGATFGIFRDYRDLLSYGAELKVLKSETEETSTLDVHLLVGLIYHWKNRDIGVGYQKTLTRDSSFVDYGIYAGMLVAF